MNILTKDGNVIMAGGGAIVAEASPPPAPTGDPQVYFIDYDGTEVETWSKDEALSKTALPTNPTHDGLIGQGWNWELSDITDYLTDYPEADVYVGQMYKTASGLTEIDVTINKITDKTIKINMVGNKDWGDGTTDNLTTHTYADYGDYTITCDGTSIRKEEFRDARHIYRIKIGEDVTNIGTYAFYECWTLSSITIPQGVTSIDTYAFINCFSLTSVTIPKGVVSISDATFYECYSLKSVSIPQGVVSIGNDAFGSSSLTSMSIPQGITSIGDSAFYSCYSLTSVSIQQGITSIGNYAFNYCYSITNYDFSSVLSIPTLGSSVFVNINKRTKIIVPIPLYHDWIEATNWSQYANYIYYDGELISVKSLSITANDVSGRATVTVIHVTAIWETDKGIDYTELKDVISDPFPQNTSETETVQRTITYSYEGLTATTTITQGVWVDQSYTLENIGSYPFELSSVVNPNPSLYDGVYQSTNKGKDSTYSIVKINFIGYDNFTVYIRSYAESSYDYTIASTLDASSYPTAYGDSTAKSHTRSNQKSGTAITNYTKVEYPNDGGEHFIYIVYRKDGSSASGDDRGYFLIEK